MKSPAGSWFHRTGGCWLVCLSFYWELQVMLPTMSSWLLLELSVLLKQSSRKLQVTPAQWWKLRRRSQYTPTWSSSRAPHNELLRPVAPRGWNEAALMCLLPAWLACAPHQCCRFALFCPPQWVWLSTRDWWVGPELRRMFWPVPVCAGVARGMSRWFLQLNVVKTSWPHFRPYTRRISLCGASASTAGVCQGWWLVETEAGSGEDSSQEHIQVALRWCSGQRWLHCCREEQEVLQAVRESEPEGGTTSRPSTAKMTFHIQLWHWQELLEVLKKRHLNITIKGVAGGFIFDFFCAFTEQTWFMKTWSSDMVLRAALC